MTDFQALLAGASPASAGDGEESTETRAAIYARTSSVNQQFGYSIDEQVRQCWDRCQMLDWPVIYLFRDAAESGKDTERPMFQQMLGRAEEGQFDVVVFWKLDRFSRSIMHAVTLEKEFRDWGIGLHSITEQIDTTTAAGRFNFRNIANAAEFERDLIKQRTQMGFKALALEHKWPNDSPPLGYKKGDDGRLEVLDDEARFVRDIFEMYVEMRSMPEVAHSLNQQGQTTKTGKPWSPRAVGDVLRNEIYVGLYAVADVEDYIDEYRILDSELFDRVQRVRQRFQSGQPERRESMPRARKANHVTAVVERYSDYLDNTDHDQ